MATATVSVAKALGLAAAAGGSWTKTPTRESARVLTIGAEQNGTASELAQLSQLI